VNAARKDSKDFSRAFLIITPGITIRDRLRVLLPSEPDNYYETREIVPPEMLPEIRRAEIVITNYHAFQHRETFPLPKVARSFLQGNAPEPVKTTETDAEMLARACGKLLNHDHVNVINDEAHHCYRHKVGDGAEGALTGDDKKEAAENEQAARLWINGIEALDRKLSKGVRAVYDLSATPFFLRGSGYPEGYLFPWVVSDFSLMDAIESGIVKLPRVPERACSACAMRTPFGIMRGPGCCDGTVSAVCGRPAVLATLPAGPDVTHSGHQPDQSSQIGTLWNICGRIIPA
jgi:type III restriction enzyme